MSTDPHHHDVFGAGSSEAVRDWLLAQIYDPTGPQVADFFRVRAAALVSSAAPVLVWLRENIGLVLDQETTRHTLSLSCLCMLARRRGFIGLPTPCGESMCQDVSAMPDDLLLPVHRYLSELPGYHPNAPWPELRDGQAASVHYYAVMYFIPGLLATAA